MAKCFAKRNEKQQYFITPAAILHPIGQDKNKTKQKQTERLQKLVNWLAGWLARWLVGWLIGWLVGFMIGKGAYKTAVFHYTFVDFTSHWPAGIL